MIYAILQYVLYVLDNDQFIEALNNIVLALSEEYGSVCFLTHFVD